jgi:hypothetical protein
MLSDEATEFLLRELFQAPEDNVYAILDGASIPQLAELPLGLPGDFVCLFPGELGEALARAAPYLVRLDREAPITRTLIAEGFGAHWGVFARSPLQIEFLQIHLRGLFQVYGPAPDHAPLFFRYYDPRVLRAYVKICTADELRALFGPIRCFLLEGEPPNCLLRIAAGQGVANIDTIPLPGAPSEKT